MRTDYFKDELSYLRESGNLFAQRNPKLVKYLSTRSTDPDVERLLEGFAFLTSRLREKLDDEFPELYHSMIQLIWPNFLRPFPATTLMQFDIKDRSITERQVIPKGTVMASQSVGDVSCRFSTTDDLTVYPFAISDVGITKSMNTSILDIAVHNLSGLPLAKLALNDLRLWFVGNPFTAQTLTCWANRYRKSVKLLTEQGEVLLPADKIKPGGMAAREALLPSGATAFHGYELLREYFIFPQKFCCLDLTGLEDFARDNPASSFTIRIEFERLLPPEAILRADNIQLFCVPAVNLFDRDAEPLKIDHLKTQYAIRPSANAGHAYQIFSIDRVACFSGAQDADSAGAGQWIDYPAFESFDHESHLIEHDQLYFRERRQDSLRHEGFDHTVAFIHNDLSRGLPSQESLTAELTVFNGSIAAELAVGDVTLETEQTPPFATFKNITRPTKPVYPPLDGRLYWDLISSLSLNYRSLLEIDSLKTIIELYDFAAKSDRSQERAGLHRLDGIHKLETQPKDKLFKGLPVRGMRSTLTLDASHFESEGDMFIFASVISEFCAQYASLNSFHELEVYNTDNGEEYAWPTNAGRQPLI